MLRIGSGGRELCDGIPRREFLCLGGLALFGLGLPELLACQAETSGGRAKSCIRFFQEGGLAHQDSWDIKPEAPVRALFG